MRGRRPGSRRQQTNQRGRGGNQEIPLTTLPEGTTGKVVRIRGGRGVCKRLAEMGFHQGALVRMESKHSPGMGGPVAISVKGCKIGLGRGIARKVIVKPVNGLP